MDVDRALGHGRVCFSPNLGLTLMGQGRDWLGFTPGDLAGPLEVALGLALSHIPIDMGGGSSLCSPGPEGAKMCPGFSQNLARPCGVWVKMGGLPPPRTTRVLNSTWRGRHKACTPSLLGPVAPKGAPDPGARKRAPRFRQISALPQGVRAGIGVQPQPRTARVLLLRYWGRQLALAP